MTDPRRIVYFITSHGFGHASRSCAVISAIQERDPSISFDIYSETPAWFFQDALQGTYTHNIVKTDVGLIQSSPMRQDLPATLALLEDFYSNHSTEERNLVHSIESQPHALIISDISPLGIEVGEKAGIPTVLIENFTWDWIYDGYRSKHSAFGKFIEINRRINQKAKYHIQTDPVCLPDPSADLLAPPISRRPTQSREETRKRLGVLEDECLVLVTMGGVPEHFQNLSHVKPDKGMRILIPGASDTFTIQDQLILLPHHSEFFHPNLIQASDIVIGKAGYSTIAEVFHANKPFGYLTRSDFRESQPLADFIDRNHMGINIPEDEFYTGDWMPFIRKLREKHSTDAVQRINGAEVIANFILDRMNSEKKS